jgi:hypothetical protein
LTATALNSLRDCIQNNISYARYKVGSTYYTAEIRSSYVMSDGRLAITFIIDHTLPGDITVSEVQLYDHNGVMWASKAESIVRKALQQGILYRFTFSVAEG